ncbi:MAG: ATP-binding protein, partial [Alphaproteobacteria bacterium]|nr:ATP-binding protein [Alphaproteobacteria bacterium]
MSIINDLLDLAKVEAGHFELMEEQFQLSDMVAATSRLTQERASQGRVRVLLEMDGAVDFVQADQRAMKQVVLNLLTNAIKFTPEGGQVTIGSSRGRDDGDGDGYFELWVSDTGIGMKAEDIPHALTPFAQLDGSFTRHFEGTGLGLPFARHLCELHGGSLSIRSTL